MLVYGIKEMELPQFFSLAFMPFTGSPEGNSNRVRNIRIYHVYEWFTWFLLVKGCSSIPVFGGEEIQKYIFREHIYLRISGNC